MKSSIAKTILAAGIGLMTASAANAGPLRSTALDIGHDSVQFAKMTWRGTENVAMTAVHLPVIAYDDMRGRRPMASRERSHREQFALTGHHHKSSESMNTHSEPPI